MLAGIYASQMMSNSNAVSCGLDTNYSGGEGFPNEIPVTLGSGLGAVLLTFSPSQNPDKFEVWYGGVKVIDTGYVGNPSYQAVLNTELISRGLPTETIVPVKSSSASVESMANYDKLNYAAFLKTTPSAVATVKVFSPLGGTAWGFKLYCPDGYYYQAFTSSGDFVVPAGVTSVDALIVAGGGGGAAQVFNATNIMARGGGGAGGVIVAESIPVTPLDTLPVTVGAGGAGGIVDNPQTSQLNHSRAGSNSVFAGFTAVGGGGGGIALGVSPTGQGADGGSGGGGTRQNSGGVGTSGQGNDGGDGAPNATDDGGSGGGGYGGAGGNAAVDKGGVGGIGLALPAIGFGGAVSAGATLTLAGGGGGGTFSNSSLGGADQGGVAGYGGGNGGTGYFGAGQSAQPNTGSGGGGQGGGGSGINATVLGQRGGNGADGIVVIRWAAT